MPRPTPGTLRRIDSIDPKTQQDVPMLLADAQTKTRTDLVYGYDQSTNGRQAAAQFTTQLATAFGAI